MANPVFRVTTVTPAISFGVGIRRPACWALEEHAIITTFFHDHTILWNIKCTILALVPCINKRLLEQQTRASVCRFVPIQAPSLHQSIFKQTKEQYLQRHP